MAKKLDGIIEAVRFNPNGKIEVVRAYELRGVAYSDRVILDRKTLLERLKKGKKFAIGQRVEFWGGTFDVGKRIKVSGADGKEILTTRDDSANHDELEGAPAF